METFNSLAIIREFQAKEISLFTLADFSRLFKIDRPNTVYKKIQRLEREKIVKKLIKGRYLFMLKKASEFTIANFLCQPSYISLESALAFYGIMTGFSYQITSLTLKKTRAYTIDQKEYHYTRISPNLFWGWDKKEDFLMATPEKALLDYLYLCFKGLRQLDLEELDLKAVNKKKFKEYFKIIKNPLLLKFLKRTRL